ncbi:MAG: hypothetical protein RL689_2156, partial [Planctomycetota bacterium]|jgi:non-ribosomal peptide synthetase-like protein
MTPTAAVTTRDLYETRTAAALAERLGGVRTQRSPAKPLSRPSARVAEGGPARHVLTTAAQGAWILLQLLVVGAAGYAAVFGLFPSLLDRFGILGSILIEIPVVLGSILCYVAATVLLTVVLKLALIGEYRPIRTPVWSGSYLRHWIVQSAARTIPWDLLAGTTACGAVLRLLGAKVGRRVHIHKGVNLQQGGWDLLTLGDDVTIGRDAHLGLISLDDGCLCVAPVRVHDGATLDTRASVSGHTTVEAGGFLTALSWLSEGERIPAGERWDGVPAAPQGRAPNAPTTTSTRIHPTLYSAIHLLVAGLAWSLAPMPLLAALYALASMSGVSAEGLSAWLADPSWSGSSAAAVAAASVLSVPIGLAMLAIGLRCIGRVRPSVIDRWSVAYVRVWFKAAAVESAGLWLTGTLYWPLWLRLAGMKVGRGCEISTIADVVPETISIGEESFFADGIYLGGPNVHRGTVTVGDTSLGRGTFLGNHVVIPAGASLPDGLFIGVCTVADATQARANTSWFGKPPLELPRRDVVKVDPRLTHAPGVVRYCNRLMWESLRFTLPILPLVAAWLWVWGVTLADVAWPVAVFVVAPAVTLVTIAAECLAVVALKWLLLGRARAGQHPLWSCWCSRWDFLYVAWQFYALRALAALEGTLFLAVYLRMMGVRVGRRVVLGPGMAQLADPDMIVIEDDATVNANYQAHSFEDRVLKLAPVIVRRGATVGESAVVFYGADVGEKAWVTPNSVVMKNERLGANRSFGGCPVQDMEAAEDGGLEPKPPLATRLASEPDSRTGRLAFLDVARGLAVIGMIFMHVVPAERADEGVVDAWVAMAAFLQGKAAALFCVLAGIAWEMQARVPHGRWYALRRMLALLAVGVAFHVLAWPTEILVPFAFMMACSLALRRMGRRAVLIAAIMLLAAAPAVPALFGHVIENDWTADGGHLADTELGLSTIRALLIDGNYPLVPWLAFPLVGMLMTPSWEGRDASRSIKRWFGSAVAAFALSQALVWSVEWNKESIGGLATYLGSTWVPTSLPFAFVTGSVAVAVISGLAWWSRSWRMVRVTTWLALLGRASLTHYLAHVCLLYLPLRAVLGHEEWSVAVGVGAFVGYLVVAVPLTVLWFRRFRRGPAEALWALASGR